MEREEREERKKERREEMGLTEYAVNKSLGEIATEHDCGTVVRSEV
jgi:hypothetical protein